MLDRRGIAKGRRVERVDFMRACREGGSAMDGALRSMDQTYFAILHRDCRRMVRDSELAREIVHETFIKVWRRCATFKGESELLPWIRAILRRTTLDQLRTPVREFSFDLEALEAAVNHELLPVGATPAGTPEGDARSRELADIFERGWRRFVEESPQHAAVIRWISEDGLDTQQIAELLERTPGATREYISQCRKRARFYLAEWYAQVSKP